MNNPHGQAVAVAVSGGADSMALLLMLHEEYGSSLHALTVDHRLRPESTDEAKQVAKWCAQLGIAHTILTWHHGEITSGKPQRARDARYQLMFDWCRAHNVTDLFTAHHLDDQIETFFFRLLRGSGMEGLAGILPVSSRSGIILRRPLLCTPKSQLIDYLKQRRQPWIEDPSNRDVSTTRNALRTHLLGLDDAIKERISQLTISFAKIRNCLENKLIESIGLCYEGHEAGFGRLSIRPFLEQKQEMRTRVAAHLCTLISGDATPIRSEKIARLADVLSAPSPNRKTTLHGVVFQYVAKEESWLVYREKKNIATPLLLSSTPQWWDDRFLVRALRPGTLTCGALGNAPASIKKILERSGIPKSVWPTLPALYVLEECVSVPHINWGETLADLQPVSAKTLAGAGISAHSKNLIFINGAKKRAQ